MDIKCKSIQISVGEKNMKTNTSYSGQDFRISRAWLESKLAGFTVPTDLNTGPQAPQSYLPSQQTVYPFK